LADKEIKVTTEQVQNLPIPEWALPLVKILKSFSNRWGVMLQLLSGIKQGDNETLHKAEAALERKHRKSVTENLGGLEKTMRDALVSEIVEADKKLLRRFYGNEFLNADRLRLELELLLSSQSPLPVVEMRKEIPESQETVEAENISRQIEQPPVEATQFFDGVGSIGSEDREWEEEEDYILSHAGQLEPDEDLIDSSEAALMDFLEVPVLKLPSVGEEKLFLSLAAGLAIEHLRRGRVHNLNFTYVDEQLADLVESICPALNEDGVARFIEYLKISAEKYFVPDDSDDIPF
jgi:hypothetical protein